MKLPQRINQLFIHAHTIAGISISTLLFVIFFAGAFSIFRWELYQWENPNARIPVAESVDLDQVIEAIKTYDPLFDPHSQFTLRPPSHEQPLFSVFGASFTDTAKTSTERFVYYLKVSDGEYTFSSDGRAFTTVGETLYRLHYLRPLPFALYISGFISIFFLLATISGLVIHWNSIVSKFFALSYSISWKALWRNAHTVLGLVGLPFQIMYAVTGAFFGLLTLLLIPAALVFFEGDPAKVQQAVAPNRFIDGVENAQPAKMLPVNPFFKEVVNQYPGYTVGNAQFSHYGDEDAYVIFNFDNNETINGLGQVGYNLATGERIVSFDPSETTYVNSVLNTITRLHFARFGGYAMRIVYVLLALLTCGMLLTGVLLWYEARNNKKYAPEQRRFQYRLTKGYLSFCLALIPASALLFIANKVIPLDVADRVYYVKLTFFLGWLLITVLGFLPKQFASVNKVHFSLTGLCGVLIPLVNGIVTTDWLWVTAQNGMWYVFGVDAFWLTVGLGSFFIASKIRSKEEVESTVPVTRADEILAEGGVSVS
ncbi:MAG: PepSY-associated TM helix domain-containing protein [Bacteroidota bacterium]